MRVRILLFTAALSLLATIAFAAQSSVPNLINFQGKLTDPAGNPVTDGSHSANFSLWTLRTGGLSVWSEITTQTTAGGLFTHQLGSVSSLSPTLFQDYDSLFLEIVADGQTITPRTKLTSVPYSRVAGGLEVGSASGFCAAPNQLAIETDASDHRISTYGCDGQEQIRLWGVSWGEMLLHDQSAANVTTARLSAQPSFNPSGGGGELFLRNNPAGSVIDLYAGNTGDASVVLPTDAINSAEIKDEPGVANNDNTSFFNLNAGNIVYVVDSVDINIPAAGYVEVTCGAWLNLFHTNLTTTEVWFEPGEARGSLGFPSPGGMVASVPSVTATSVWQFPATSSRFFAATAGTHRYYLHARYAQGTNASTNVAAHYIRATYYPTLYGTATLATSVGGTVSELSQVATDGSLRLPKTELATITVQDHNARLEAELAKMRAEMEARIQKLESQVNQSQQVGENEK